MYLLNYWLNHHRDHTFYRSDLCMFFVFLCTRLTLTKMTLIAA